jgi:opacity protein-like surface antigen
MKSIILAAAVLTAFSMPVFAQTTTDTTTPAVATPDTKNAKAPIEGENSFTEGQAKARIQDGGYTDVSGLKLDDKGVWRGTAMKDGKSVQVGLDYQGNVVTQ